MTKEKLQGSKFALIGDPVAHSLSPRMHNALFAHLAQSERRFAGWSYTALLCVDEPSALEAIASLREGHLQGMNVTMPWKPLAYATADVADEAAQAADGANVLVMHDGALHAYNTDGTGAVRAIKRTSGLDLCGMRAVVCGTGPTSMSIACAMAISHAREVAVLSRSKEKALSAVTKLSVSLEGREHAELQGASYEEADDVIISADIFVDATPRGMNRDDEAIVDIRLLQADQIVLDTVYAHGTTKLLAGARARGAFAMDGTQMLVEQAALSDEIWFDALGIKTHVSRAVMRAALSS